MNAERELAWALVEVTSERFTAADRLRVYTPLGGGDSFQAITEVLDIVARQRYLLSDSLLRALARWLDAYVGCEHEPAARNLLSEISGCADSGVSGDCLGNAVRLPKPAVAWRISDRAAADDPGWQSRRERAM
jgi:hypothetical protein